MRTKRKSELLLAGLLLPLLLLQLVEMLERRVSCSSQPCVWCATNVVLEEETFEGFPDSMFLLQ